MLIISGYLLVPVDQRDAFVAAHADLVARARAFPGCLDLAISADSVDPTRINNVELWSSEANLAAWRKISDPPASTFNIQTNTVQKHVISHSGPPF